MICDCGLKEHLLLQDHDTTVYALITLFTKHPELVTAQKSPVLADLITHASTVTVHSSMKKKPYAHAKLLLNQALNLR
jgi:hypothetical protein